METPEYLGSFNLPRAIYIEDGHHDAFYRILAIAERMPYYIVKSLQFCFDCMERYSQGNDTVSVAVPGGEAPGTFSVYIGGRLPLVGLCIFHGDHSYFGCEQQPTFACRLDSDHGWRIHT